jgi:ADP-ribosyl-[dinitrogen reductase] hydrolase
MFMCALPEGKGSLVFASVGQRGSVGTTPHAIAECWGSSGFVVESVPLAIYAAQAVARLPFEEVIRQAVAAGGDADTVASMAGQIAGARVGSAGLPAGLLARMPEAAEVRRIAEDFAGAL